MTSSPALAEVPVTEITWEGVGRRYHLDAYAAPRSDSIFFVWPQNYWHFPPAKIADSTGRESGAKLGTDNLAAVPATAVCIRRGMPCQVNAKGRTANLQGRRGWHTAIIF
jgi:hypothetical protein